MDIKEIKQIIDLMKRSELVEFEIEEEGLKLRIKRDSGHPATYATMPQYLPAPVSAPAPAAVPAARAVGTSPAMPEEGFAFIKSPMVGTFYRAPNPDSASFTDVGEKVSPESVVCIIEAMKVMNEIQAEVAGTIVEVLTENGRSVEYGQPLFKVRTK